MRLASAAEDGTVKVWDLGKPKGQECVKTIECSTPVNSVAFQPKNQDIIAISACRGLVGILDISKPKGQEITKTLFHHKIYNPKTMKKGGPEYSEFRHGYKVTSVNSVIFHPTKKHIAASMSENGIVIVWDISKKDEHAYCKVFGPYPYASKGIDSVLAFHPTEEDTLFFKSSFSKMIMWNLSKQEGGSGYCNILTGPGSPVEVLVRNQTEERKHITAAKSLSPTVIVRDLSQKGKPGYRTRITGSCYVGVAALHPTQKGTIVIATHSCKIVVWRMIKEQEKTLWRCEKILKGHNKIPCSLIFHPIQTNILASASSDGTIILWDLSKPKGQEYVYQLRVKKHRYKIPLTFHPTNPNIIFFTLKYGSIVAWDISKPKGQECIKMLNHGSPVNSIACSCSMEKRSPEKIEDQDRREEMVITKGEAADETEQVLRKNMRIQPKFGPIINIYKSLLM